MAVLKKRTENRTQHKHG